MTGGTVRIYRIDEVGQAFPVTNLPTEFDARQIESDVCWGDARTLAE